MSTITKEQQDAIAAFIANRHIPSGLGTAEAACSIASINLALTGRLTDTVPDCMSEVLGAWMIAIQDPMPDTIRNSSEYRALLPLAAGTGRIKERERLAILTGWLFGTVLPTLQGVADSHGFGGEWTKMCNEKTAAYAAAYASDAAAYAAAYAADAAAYAAARAAAYAAAHVADASDAAAYAAARAAAQAAQSAAWASFDVCGVLQKLIEC